MMGEKCYVCPECGSTDTTRETEQTEGDMIVEVWSCDSCLSMYEAKYDLFELEVLE